MARHGLHPVRVQLRHRGAARRRGRPPLREGARRQGAPLLPGLRLREAVAPRLLPERRHRLTTPLRRRPDGSFEEIDWDTADPRGRRALRGRARRARRRVDLLLRRRRPGQPPARRLLARPRSPLLGSRYRSNALAQEKTGEFWVSGKMIGAFTRSDFEHCEVGVFLGKNPWFSHGIPRARVTLREIARDPDALPDRDRSAPHRDRRSGRHPSAVRPGARRVAAGRDARGARPGGPPRRRLARRAQRGSRERAAPLPDAARRGVLRDGRRPEALVRQAARRIADAQSVAFFEDLGVQMNRHSTLVSYLHRLLAYTHGQLRQEGRGVRARQPCSPWRGVARPDGRAQSPVTGARIIGGLVPCNVIPEEILTDHPKRFRAMLVEAATPRTRWPTARACARRSTRSSSWW